MKQLKLATKWEVKINGKKRSIQLFDADGNKLDGSAARWDGNFNCYSNQLTSLDGAPNEVGGNFYCYSNQLTSLEGAPTSNSENARRNAKKALFNGKIKCGYLLADGILLRLISKKGNVFKGQKIGSKQIMYLAKDDKNFAHGKTAREAMEDLRFKSAERDVDQYKDWKLTKKVDTAEMKLAYHVITGACREGINDFLGGIKTKKEYTVKEVIELTEGKYGHNKFAAFFGETK